MDKKEKSFEEVKANLVNHISNIQTKEELNNFLTNLSEKYLEDRTPHIITAMFDTVGDMFGRTTKK